MGAIGAIADLPFRQRPALELLNVDVYRDHPDPDYAGFGYARLDEVVLEDARGVRRVVADPLLLAVHADDDPELLADDLELAFFCDEHDPDASVTVLLSDFLRVWLPKVRGDERAIVLVACNPHRAKIARPAAASDVPVHYAVGDVESWLDSTPQHQTFRLVAEGWRTAE